MSKMEKGVWYRAMDAQGMVEDDFDLNVLDEHGRVLHMTGAAFRMLNPSKFSGVQWVGISPDSSWFEEQVCGREGQGSGGYAGDTEMGRWDECTFSIEGEHTSLIICRTGSGKWVFSISADQADSVLTVAVPREKEGKLLDMLRMLAVAV